MCARNFLRRQESSRATGTRGLLQPPDPRTRDRRSLDPSWRYCKLEITNNVRPELSVSTRELPGNQKGWRFPRKQACLFFGKSPAFSLCACAQAGRLSRPARERQVFVSSAAAANCMKRKSRNIRNGWGPGRIILPGGAWGSAPAFPPYLASRASISSAMFSSVVAQLVAKRTTACSASYGHQ